VKLVHLFGFITKKLVWSVSKYGQVVGCCEHGNEHS